MNEHLHQENFLHNSGGEEKYSTETTSDTDIKAFTSMIIEHLETNVNDSCKKYKGHHMTGSVNVQYRNGHVEVKLKELHHELDWKMYVNEIRKEYKDFRLEYIPKRFNQLSGEREEHILIISYDKFDQVVHQRHPLQRICIWVTGGILVLVIVIHMLTRGAIV